MPFTHVENGKTSAQKKTLLEGILPYTYKSRLMFYSRFYLTMLITYVGDTSDQITASVIDTGHQSYIQISMSALIKKKRKFSSYIRKFRRDRV